MERLLEIALINAASVTVLALAVTLVGRWVKRPAVMHALWLLVLLKLVTPPLVEVAALPNHSRDLMTLARATTQPLAAPAAVRAPDPIAAAVAPSTSPIPSPTRPTPARLFVGGWLTGGVLLLGLAAFRLRRFDELIRRAGPATPSLRRRVRRVARRLGLSGRPRVGLVEGRVPPMLWSRFGPYRILVPRALIAQLDDDELDALIAHELAHVRRRDHWVRHFEMALTALFWWHPLVWWIRRNMRLEEEKSCDALVLQTFPGSSRAYAEGLLKTVEFLSGRETGVPALATGAGETRQLSERLTMILNQRVPLTTTRIQRWTIAAVAAAVLLIFPTWAEPDNANPDAENPAEQVALDRQRESVELRQQMRENELQSMQLQRAMRAEQLREEMDLLQARLAEFEARGQLEHAAELRIVIDKARRRHELAERKMDLELRMQEEMRPVAFELQQTSIEAERSRLEGDARQAAELEARAAELEQRLHDVAGEHELMQRQLQSEMMSAHAAGLAHEARELSRAGREDDARRVEQRAAELRERARADREDEARLDYELAREAETRAARELAEQRRLEEQGPAGQDEIRRLGELERDLERKLDAVEALDDAENAESLRRIRLELRRIELELDRLESETRGN